MRTRFVVTLVVALFALLGWNGAARAATVATSGTAQPGTYAARHGAPLCDQRAASSYAAEPAAPVVDGGEVESAPLGGCSRGSRIMAGAPAPDSNDDLHRSAPMARELATLPIPVVVGPCICAQELPRAFAQGAPHDGYDRDDYVPPRPVPWSR